MFRSATQRVEKLALSITGRSVGADNAAGRDAEGSGLVNVDAVKQVLEFLRSAVYLVDQRGNVLYYNSKGDDVLSDSVFVRIDAAGKLIMPGFDLGKRLRSFAKANRGKRRQGQAGCLHQAALADRKTGRHYQVEIIELSHGSQPGPVSAIYAIVVVAISFQYSFSIQCIAELFGLTVSEQAVLQNMVDGCSISDIARLRGTTYETARGQLKGIFNKTGTGSQQDLLRLCFAANSGFSVPRQPSP